MQGVSDVLCGFDEFLLFDEPQHFRRGFRTRGQHKVVSQAINHFFLAVFINDISGRNQCHRPRRGGRPQSGANLAGGIWFQEVAIHIAGTAAHHVAGHNILGYCCLHKASRRIHFHLAGFHVRFIDNATHTAIVVNMAMSINDGDNRLIATVFEIQIHTGFGCFRRNQRIDNRNPLFTFDNRHVG
ncbi:hypothetical protein NGUA11_00062 [Salmonella enterica]|nr:hypothetical protein NGUA11_00062 [Salmonella enterica]